jgi:hypothetical protein
MQSSKIRFDELAAIARRTTPFTALDGRAFVHVPVGPVARRTFPVRSDEFRDWFLMIAFGEFARVPTNHQFNAICRLLEGEAHRDDENIGIPVSRRVADLDTRIQIDLSNSAGEFVEIDAAGYRVASGDQGAPFETSAAALPLPAPEEPSDGDSPLDTLREFLRLAAEPAWLRCLAWLLAAMRANGPFPILILRGPAGCGKSLAARMLRLLLDPCASQFTPTPRNARELFTLARQNWVLAFDHISTLTPSLCDALCRLTSGAGIAFPEPGRRLAVQQFLRRPILMTVTDRFTLPPELASRALIVDLPALTPETRRTEQALRGDIVQALPKTLGALYTALSRALANHPKPIATTTRHADTLAWVCAAFPHLESQLRAAIEEPPPPHPVVAAIRTLLVENPTWTGSATDLVKRLHLGPTPRALSAYLRNSVLDLTDAGIDVHFRRLPGGDRVIDLTARFASQIPAPIPQPKFEVLLTPPPKLPPTSETCVTRDAETLNAS